MAGLYSKNLYQHSNSTLNEQTVYTCPAGKVAIVRYVSFYCRTVGNIAPYAAVLPSGAGSSLVFYRAGATPAAASWISWEGWVILQAGDALRIDIASAGTPSFDVYVTGYEINA